MRFGAARPARFARPSESPSSTPSASPPPRARAGAASLVPAWPSTPRAHRMLCLCSPGACVACLDWHGLDPWVCSAHGLSEQRTGAASRSVQAAAPRLCVQGRGGRWVPWHKPACTCLLRRCGKSVCLSALLRTATGSTAAVRPVDDQPMQRPAQAPSGLSPTACLAAGPAGGRCIAAAAAAPMVAARRLGAGSSVEPGLALGSGLGRAVVDRQLGSGQGCVLRLPEAQLVRVSRVRIFLAERARSSPLRGASPGPCAAAAGAAPAAPAAAASPAPAAMALAEAPVRAASLVPQPPTSARAAGEQPAQAAVERPADPAGELAGAARDQAAAAPAPAPAPSASLAAAAAAVAVAPEQAQDAPHLAHAAGDAAQAPPAVAQHASDVELRRLGGARVPCGSGRGCVMPVAVRVAQ